MSPCAATVVFKMIQRTVRSGPHFFLAGTRVVNVRCIDPLSNVVCPVTQVADGFPFTVKRQGTYLRSASREKIYLTGAGIGREGTWTGDVTCPT